MTIQKLAEDTIESLADNRQSVREFLTAFIAEARFRAARATKEAADYTNEELEYYAQVEDDARPARVDDLRAVVRDFLGAVDKGYYFTTAAELADSAFVAALRKAVA